MLLECCHSDLKFTKEATIGKIQLPKGVLVMESCCIEGMLVPMQV